MHCSDSSEMVQKGREKSWWSMCGGMQSSCSHARMHCAHPMHTEMTTLFADKNACCSIDAMQCGACSQLDLPPTTCIGATDDI